MSEDYDITPAGDDKEWLSYVEHDGTGQCAKCKTVGAHSYETICNCCGKAISRFEVAEYLEAD